MGLISLSYLNKIQDSNYWNNVWDSKLLYKKYLYLSLFLNKYINIIFSDYSLNILIKHIINLNLKKGFLLNSNIKKNYIKNYILGKIWLLKFQNWYIIIVKIFNLNMSSKLFLKNKNKNWVNYTNNINLNNNFVNYKFKF
uniref:Ribosomal protein S3 n=1 Tax=Uronema marinum TaxID=35107 RepID=A0A345WJU3_UROMR|nr:ribosomal protein S3 [Uronema marinum]AXJ93336.1 ribosomal protein S3 [Uronema marinum]